MRHDAVCATTNAGAVRLIISDAQNNSVNPNTPAVSVLYTLSVEVFRGEGLTPGPLSVNVSFSGVGAPVIGITFHGMLYDVYGSPNTDGASAAEAYLSDSPWAFLTDPRAIPMIIDPEPSSVVLAGLGVVGMLIARRRFC